VFLRALARRHSSRPPQGPRLRDRTHVVRAATRLHRSATYVERIELATLARVLRHQARFI